MQVKGIVFVGTRTQSRTAMSAFVRDVLQLTPVADDTLDADLFAMADGSRFAVTRPDDLDQAERTVGFLVDDVDAAAVELQRAGIATDQVSASQTQRYVHFRAPDGALYELVENF